MISNNKSFENLEVTPPYPVSRRITSDSTPLLVEHSGYSQTFVPAGRLPHLQPENAWYRGDWNKHNREKITLIHRHFRRLIRLFLTLGLAGEEEQQEQEQEQEQELE